MPSVARLPVLRTTLVGIGHFLAAGTVLAQELDIPLVAEPPRLADFVSMAPPEDVRSRYGRRHRLHAARALGRRAVDATHRRLFGLRLEESLRRVRRARRRARERARESRAAREHRERRPRRLAHRHVRRSAHGLRLPLEPARRAVGRALDPRSARDGVRRRRTRPSGTPTGRSPRAATSC